MGILRADIISHSQLLDGNGSVLFDGTTDSITIPSHSAFAFGTADYTVEGWFYFTALSGQQTLVGDTYGATNGFYFYKRSDHKLGWYYDNSNYWSANTLIETDRWYHLAFVRHGGTARIYIDGVLDGEDTTDTFDATVTQYYIGDTADQTSGEFFGYMSNLRITRTAVYKDNFTVPKFKLKEIPGTILLCCQSSSSTTEAAVSVAGTLTANGDPTATNFGPGLKEDIKDTGVVFDGFGNFATSTYMVPPGGTTTQSNRGRGVFAQGYSPGDGASATLNYFEISSGGITQSFGNLTQSTYTMTAGSSSTRGVLAGGYLAAASPIYDINTIEYVTIATTSNAIDFGDRTTRGRTPTAVSSETRVCMAGGYSNPTYTNIIDFITTATTGDATNFGDLGNQRSSFCNSMQSTTRGIFAGGYQEPSPHPAVNTLEYITMASAGDATNFGDMTSVGTNSTGGSMSSNTRGVTALGNAPGATNIINYVTIATTGDAADFGDMTTTRKYSSSCSSHIRGVIIGGETPTYVNTIEYITIATTGNSLDFGDVGGGLSASSRGAACSDCHGGLS